MTDALRELETIIARYIPDRLGRLDCTTELFDWWRRQMVAERDSRIFPPAPESVEEASVT